MGLLLYCYDNITGAPQAPGPVFTALGGDIVMGELGRFSASTVQVPLDDRRAILAMAPYTYVEIEQEDIGIIATGYILRPEQQVADDGTGTLTLNIAHRVADLMRQRTGHGWTAANFLSFIVQRLGRLRPGWDAVLVQATGVPMYSTRFENVTPVDALLQLATDTSNFARISRSADGTPLPVIELGQFGADTGITVEDSGGAAWGRVEGNDRIRLIGSLVREPNTVESLVNTVIPLGGGSTPDSLVDLERLWRILNDPTYPDFGKYGTAAGSVFPEYDPAYPISDPYPDTAATQRGPVGSRRATLDGRRDHYVYDAASVAAWGISEGDYVDSGLTYADNSPANQLLTERALYVAVTAKLKRTAHPHHTLAFTTYGLGRPPREGDTVLVNYTRVAADAEGIVVPMAVYEDVRVVGTTRHFAGEAVPVDTVTLSNLGRFEDDDPTASAAVQQQLVALQINQGTGLAPLPIYGESNVDALHPLDVPVDVPAELFRWHKCSLRVDFFPYRGTATTAENSAATITITDIAHGTHTIAPQPGHAFGTTGIGTTSDPIGGMPDHEHDMDVLLGTGAAPTAADNWLSLSVGGHGGNFLRASRSAPSDFVTGFVHQTSFNLTPTDHPHTVPISPTVEPQHTTLTGPLPQHTHPLDQRIPDGPLAPNCTVAINGQLLTSSLTLTSGSRNADGTFPGSFRIDDISPLLAGTAGTTVTLTFTPGTAAGNQYGVGYFKVTGTWFGEYGGLTSTVQAS
jgi:hypothetical protein